METEDFASEEYFWIGGVLRNEDIRENYVRFTPVAFFDGKSDSWAAIDSQQRFRYFCNEGKALYFGREREEFKQIDIHPRLYQFGLELTDVSRSPYSPDDQRFAKYWIPSFQMPTSLACVLDWTTRGVSAELPTVLANAQSLNNLPIQRVYIRHSAQIYGPIQIDPISGRPREYAQSSDTGGKPLMVKLYSAASKALFPIMFNDERVTLLDEERLEDPRGEADWSLPQVVIKRVLDASKRLTPNEPDGSALVDRRIKELARAAGEQAPEAFKLSMATIERAKRIASDRQAIVNALEGLEHIVLGLPALKPQIDEAISEEKRRRTEDIRRDIDAQLADERRMLEQMQSDVSDATTQLNRLNSEIAEAEKRKKGLSQEVEEFERTVTQRLESLRAQPMQALADLQLASLLLPIFVNHPGIPISSSNGKHVTMVTDVLPAHSNSADVAAQSIISQPSFGKSDFCGCIEWNTSASALADLTPATLRKQSRIASSRFCALSKDVRASAAALLAGFIPVPIGNGSSASLRALADMLAGGRVWTIPVSLTTLGTSDLFGSIDQATHQFSPAAGALADMALAARQHPDDLGLVIFEGLDRVPGMPTYAPLLRHYIDVQRHMLRGPAPAPLTLFHPRLFEQDDPYAALARFTWPSNLLIAGILDDAPDSFPIPYECEDWLVRPKVGLAKLSEKTSPTATTAVSFSEWRHWRRGIYSKVKDDEPVTFFTELLETSLRALGSSEQAEIDTFIESYERPVEED